MFDKYENLATLVGFEPGAQWCEFNVTSPVLVALVWGYELALLT